MNEAKEKDYVLAQLADHTPPHEVEGLSKYADELEADGYINILSSEDGFIIRALVTDKGARILESGGYTARHKAERKSKLSAKAWVVIGAVGGSVLTELVHRLAEWLTK